MNHQSKLTHINQNYLFLKFFLVFRFLLFRESSIWKSNAYCAAVLVDSFVLVLGLILVQCFRKLAMQKETTRARTTKTKRLEKILTLNVNSRFFFSEIDRCFVVLPKLGTK